jgi:hypothetical protein
MGFADRVVELIEYHGNERHWRMADLVHGLCFRRFTEVRIRQSEMAVLRHVRPLLLSK